MKQVQIFVSRHALSFKHDDLLYVQPSFICLPAYSLHALKK